MPAFKLGSNNHTPEKNTIYVADHLRISI